VTTRGEVLLQTHGLAVGRRVPLLRDVAWELHSGQCWFLLGPNGAGKSTLLLTALGLLPPLAGSVSLHESLWSRRSLGFVPQQDASAVTLPITVAEFVALGLCDLPMSKAELHERRDRAIAAMGMALASSQKVAELSLGQRRRTLVARAMARQPRLLVIDEPTANLDPETSMRFAADLDRLRRETGVCIVHAAHDLLLASQFATHVARIVGDRLEVVEPAAIGGPTVPR
jgi:ABC-type Mn2+/Zn2+ transport system ATPase subunit